MTMKKRKYKLTKAKINNLKYNQGFLNFGIDSHLKLKKLKIKNKVKPENIDLKEVMQQEDRAYWAYIKKVHLSRLLEQDYEEYEIDDIECASLEEIDRKIEELYDIDDKRSNEAVNIIYQWQAANNMYYGAISQLSVLQGISDDQAERNFRIKYPELSKL